jgi:hypothetical protein
MTGGGGGELLQGFHEIYQSPQSKAEQWHYWRVTRLESKYKRQNRIPENVKKLKNSESQTEKCEKLWKNNSGNEYKDVFFNCN